MLRRLQCVVLVFSVFSRNNFVLMELFHIDIDDILNEKFMPTALFLQQNSKLAINNTTGDHLHTDVNKADGNFSQAFSTMGFHRKMMNEYLCTNFVANQILRELAPPKPHLERRIGTTNENVLGKTSKQSLNHKSGKSLPQDVFLSDQGSSEYTKWLSKTTTLEDIQKQIGENLSSSGNKSNKKDNREKINSINRRHEFENGENQDDYYDEGDITGYALNKPLTSDFKDIPPESYAETNMDTVQEPYPPQRSVTINNKNAPYYYHHSRGYPAYPHHYEHPSSYHHPAYENAEGSYMSTHSEGFYPSAHESYDEHGHYGGHAYPVQQDNAKSKELGIKDFIDIALTTLAFLSFGMFILQVLMCITMNKPNNNLMMMPMEADGAADEITEEIRRKRSLDNNLDSERIRKVNEIARRVLISIEYVLYAKVDEGNCLQQIICENNKYARQQKDGQKMWIPVWSLGLSWLSARFVPAKTSTSTTLNSLKAAAIGLGGGNCYPNCEFGQAQNEKKKMARKAATEQTRNFNFEWTQ